jgi:hypothetical protein
MRAVTSGSGPRAPLTTRRAHEVNSAAKPRQGPSIVAGLSSDALFKIVTAYKTEVPPGDAELERCIAALCDLDAYHYNRFSDRFACVALAHHVGAALQTAARHRDVARLGAAVFTSVVPAAVQRRSTAATTPDSSSSTACGLTADELTKLVAFNSTTLRSAVAELDFHGPRDSPVRSTSLVWYLDNSAALVRRAAMQFGTSRGADSAATILVDCITPLLARVNAVSALQRQAAVSAHRALLLRTLHAVNHAVEAVGPAVADMLSLMITASGRATEQSQVKSAVCCNGIVAVMSWAMFLVSGQDSAAPDSSTDSKRGSLLMAIGLVDSPKDLLHRLRCADRTAPFDISLNALRDAAAALGAERERLYSARFGTEDGPLTAVGVIAGVDRTLAWLIGGGGHASLPATMCESLSTIYALAARVAFAATDYGEFDIGHAAARLMLTVGRAIRDTTKQVHAGALLSCVAVLRVTVDPDTRMLVSLIEASRDHESADLPNAAKTTSLRRYLRCAAAVLSSRFTKAVIEPRAQRDEAIAALDDTFARVAMCWQPQVVAVDSGSPSARTASEQWTVLRCLAAAHAALVTYYTCATSFSSPERKLSHVGEGLTAWCSRWAGSVQAAVRGVATVTLPTSLRSEDFSPLAECYAWSAVVAATTGDPPTARLPAAVAVTFALACPSPRSLLAAASAVSVFNQAIVKCSRGKFVALPTKEPSAFEVACAGAIMAIAVRCASGHAPSQPAFRSSRLVTDSASSPRRLARASVLLDGRRNDDDRMAYNTDHASGVPRRWFAPDEAAAMRMSSSAWLLSSSCGIPFSRRLQASGALGLSAGVTACAAAGCLPWLRDDLVLVTIALSSDGRSLHISRQARTACECAAVTVPLLLDHRSAVDLVVSEHLDIIRSDMAGVASVSEQLRCEPSFDDPDGATASDSATGGAYRKASKDTKKEWWAARQASDRRMATLISEGIEGTLLGPVALSLLAGHYSSVAARADNRRVAARLIEALADWVRSLEENERGTALPRYVYELIGSASFCAQLECMLLAAALAPSLYLTADGKVTSAPAVGEAIAALLQLDPSALSETAAKQFESVCTTGAADAIHVAVRQCPALTGTTTDSALLQRQTSAGRISDLRKGVPRQHVLLLVEGALSRLPWESVSVLQGQRASRVPSVDYIQATLHRWPLPADKAAGIRRDSGVFVINPAGDLAKTEAKLGPIASRLRWRGYMGPRGLDSFTHRDQWTGRLLSERYDVYLYAGHDDSSLHFPVADLDAAVSGGGADNRWTWRPAALLMGCASACSTDVPTQATDPVGMMGRLMLAGCSMTVGCLWPVTDGDLDRLTAAALEGFFFSREPSDGVATPGEPSSRHVDDVAMSRLSGRLSRELKVATYPGVPKRSPGTRDSTHMDAATPNEAPTRHTLFDAFVAARAHCKLRHFTGASVVLFGVPMSCHQAA